MRTFFVFGPLALLAASALAQAPSIDGKWTAKWTTSNGVERQAFVEISGATGSYKPVVVTQRGRPDPCLTLVTPVAVERPNESELVLAIKGSQALAGCNDNQLTLQRVDGGKYEGKFQGGTAVVLTR